MGLFTTPSMSLSVGAESISAQNIAEIDWAERAEMDSDPTGTTAFWEPE